jgi:hypothetical protein
MKLIMALLFTAAFSIPSYAGQGGKNEGQEPEPECDYVSVEKTL